MRRLLALVFLLAACGGSPAPAGGDTPTLETFATDAFAARLEASDRPVVVNVWASWCVPCRSEAPLLVAAHDRFGDQVAFVGVAIQDTPGDAGAFLAEFGIPYENLLDREARVRGVLGGTGVPITYFVAPGGDLVDTHFGVIDEGQLALGIDELLQRGG